jgi:hypothetical protein
MDVHDIVDMIESIAYYDFAFRTILRDNSKAKDAAITLVREMKATCERDPRLEGFRQFFSRVK